MSPSGSGWVASSVLGRVFPVAYAVDDLTTAARGLEERGLTLDLTPYHDGEGVLGFARFRNSGGLRVEIQNINGEPAMDAWLRGKPL
ncbi:hypothetical protein ACFYY8_10070 [Streptosporangium sp. NPDC001559]|uniref:hypothetical protein n=1 Tax=Streptosporangium sp. NPDC001559 TaxID=3366187 RepID=UPI0036E35B01